MRYVVRDGALYEAVEVEDFEGDVLASVQEVGPVAEAVSDALDVLRAAGFEVETEYEHYEYAKRDMTWERTVARSPWREVER